MWDRLRSVAGRQAPWLRAPLPPGPGCCAVCRGPARPGFRRCYQCALHRHDAAGMLADIVVPVSYSVAGTGYARALWRYKSDGCDQDAAGRALRAMLLVFLHDHGRCIWTRARMAAPTHVAVVPSGRGRPGTHPLRALVQPYLALRWADLTVCARRTGAGPGSGSRQVPGRGAAGRRERPAARRHVDLGFQRPVGRDRAEAGRRRAGGGGDPGPACQPARADRRLAQRSARPALVPAGSVRGARHRGARGGRFRP